MRHCETTDAVYQALKSSPLGLSDDAVTAVRAETGLNELVDRGGRKPLKILIEQFTATMVLLLIGAGILALALGDQLEAIAIFAIVILFGIMGFLQEYRAEKAMAALKKLSVPTVLVRRNGITVQIPAQELVPGDVVILEAGNVVPADGRITGCFGLKVQESALTGESEAVEKHAGVIADPDASLGDRKNMVYMGTQVVHGRAEVIITSTGMSTELGKIAAMIQNVKEGASPLQKRLETLGRILAGVGLAISALVAVLGVLAGESLPQMLILGISLAVAVIPEGLPAVMTITLALGAGRMLKRNALIRKLPAVETLGAVTVICSDKTGTLTQNRMTVQEVFAPAGEELVDLLGVLCSDALGTSPNWVGDPTETCLLERAEMKWFPPADVRAAFPRIAELSFDASRKRMSTLHRISNHPEIPENVLAAWHRLASKDQHLLAVKGSTDGLLDISSKCFTEHGIVPLDEKMRRRVEEQMTALAQEGKRVLGFAARSMPARSNGLELHDESDLIFIGLAGIIDPPRPEVREAVANCRSAGIRPVMITGDHPLTAKAIAKDLGIDDSDRVITGRDIETVSDAELNGMVEECSVFARVSPEHKLRIVGAFQHHRHVVAMTGDGVNDAPALRKADIGVAMGITGTDVSKEASQMVLTDDNFASIVSAVEEGRVIYDNIRKYLRFSLGGNLGKIIALMFIPLLTGFLTASGNAHHTAVPVIIALTAIQLLWLNLLGDGLLSVGLGVEQGEKGVMKRRPVKPESGVLGGDMISYIFVSGIAMGIISIGIGLWWWMHGHDLRTVQTVVFMSLFFLQMWAVFSVRIGNTPLFAKGTPPNRVIIVMTGVSIVLQILAMYTPGLNQFLSVRPIPVPDLLAIAGICAVMVPILELYKMFLRRSAS